MQEKIKKLHSDNYMEVTGEPKQIKCDSTQQTIRY